MILRRSILIGLIILAGVGLPAGAQVEPVTLVLFWAEGCPYCEAELEFLDELGDDFPDLAIETYEVRNSFANQQRFATAMAKVGLDTGAVPVTVLGTEAWVGFNTAISDQIRTAVAAALDLDDEPTGGSGEFIDVPVLGRIDLGNQSLVVATVLIALVDGINPCSLWAISVLLALVLRTGSRRRVLLIGGVFLLVTTLMYGLYIAGMYGFLRYVAGEAWVRAVMAAVALAFGVINLKDYFWSGKGLSLSIPDARKPGLYRRMRHVTAAGNSVPGALAGTIGLAVGVSLLETPCTAGYPIVWSNLVASAGAGATTVVVLFGLYMLVFLVDELVVFGTAVVAMRAVKLEEGAGRLLKLVGGMVMVALAGALLFAPQVMDSVGGALTVFGWAVVGVIGVLLLEAIRQRPGSDRRA